MSEHDGTKCEIPNPDWKTELSRKISFGLWIDDHPRKCLEEGYIHRLRFLPVDHVSVMAEDARGGFRLKWTHEQMQEFSSSLVRYNIKPIFCCWPEPTKTYIEHLDKELPRVLESLKTDTVEVDVEFNWKRHKVRGYRSLKEAGEELMKVLRKHCGEVEATTFAMHAEAGRRSTVAIHCDRLLLQSYSVRKGVSKRLIPWGHRYAPGVRQEKDIARVKKAGFENIGVGLAAWQQKGFGVSPFEAMEEALIACFDADIYLIRYWSSKWIVGHRSTSYSPELVMLMKQHKRHP